VCWLEMRRGLAVCAGAAAAAVAAAAPSAVWAQVDPAAGQGGPGTDFWVWLRASGLAGWTIILLSVAFIALAVEYALTIRRATLVPEELRLALDELIAEGRLEEARAVAEDDTSLLGKVMAAALGRRRLSDRAARDAAEQVGRAETDRLHQKIGYLALIANLCPMLGLLGTVGGMMISFDRIAFAGQPRVSELAGGIRFALVTTYEGLIVAIPATAVFEVFRNRVSRLTTAAAAAAEDLLLKAAQHARSRPAAKPLA
jgi:biopolymer transport protein ExbB